MYIQSIIFKAKNFNRLRYFPKALLKSILTFLLIINFLQIATYAKFKVSSNKIGVNNNTSANTEDLARLDEITNPKKVNAGIIDTTGKAVSHAWAFMCDVTESQSGLCMVNKPNWMLDTVYNVSASVATHSICGRTLEGLVNDISKDSKSPCIDASKINFEVSKTNEDGLVNLPGGAILPMAVAYNKTTTANEAPIPTNLALFIQTTTSKTIFGTPVYAQEKILGTTIEGFALKAWIMTRNISLGLMGMFLAISAVMVMMRTKLSPQVTVSIYNVLPMIPIVLGLIILSYPIIAIAYRLIPILLVASTQIGYALVKDSFTGSASNVNLDYGLFGLVVGAANAIFIFLAGLKGVTFAVILLMIGMLIAVAFAFIMGLFSLAKIYVSLITNLIFSPFIILMGILPGKQNIISNFAKKIIADVLTLPIMVLTLFFAFAILAYVPREAEGDILSNTTRLFSNLGLLVPFIIKNVLGIMLIFKVGEVRPAIMRMIGGNDSFFGGGGEDRRK